MKSLQELSETGTTQSILGMKAVSGNIAIGSVIKLLFEENEFTGVEIQKNSDSSIITVYRKRIEGVDEEKGELVIN